jgi:hypothetical protein
MVQKNVALFFVLRLCLCLSPDAMRCYAKVESSPVDNTLLNTSKIIWSTLIAVEMI